MTTSTHITEERKQLSMHACAFLYCKSTSEPDAVAVAAINKTITRTYAIGKAELVLLLLVLVLVWYWS